MVGVTSQFFRLVWLQKESVNSWLAKIGNFYQESGFNKLKHQRTDNVSQLGTLENSYRVFIVLFFETKLNDLTKNPL